MNETGKYLDHFAQVTSDVVTAQVVSRNGDDTYMCRIITSEAIVRAAKTNPSEEFAIGSWVLLGAISASRTVIGAMHMILSRSPREQRGVGDNPADRSSSGEHVPYVLAVDPDPLVLEQGGEMGEQVIVGGGFTAEASYVGRGSSDDPVLISDPAPVVTSAKVTMSVAADPTSNLGDFDLIINGVRIPLALRIVELSAAPADPTTFVAVAGAGAAGPELWILDKATLAPWMKIDGPAGHHSCGLFDYRPFDIDKIYWLTSDGAASTWLHVIDATGPFTDSITTIGGVAVDANVQVAAIGADWGTFPPTLQLTAPAGGALFGVDVNSGVPSTLLPAAGIAGAQESYGGGGVAVFVTGSGGTIQYDTSGVPVATATNATAVGHWIHVRGSDSVFVVGATDLYVLNRINLSLIHTFAIANAENICQADAATDAAEVFALNTVSGDVIAYDPTGPSQRTVCTLAGTGYLYLGSDTFIDGGAGICLYAMGDDRKLVRIDRITGATTTATIAIPAPFTAAHIVPVG